MKMVKSLLLGSAAGLVALTGAQAADLPVKAKPVEYVRICSAYGAGFYYIPGTDVCLRVGGYSFTEFGWNGRNAAALIYSGTIGADMILNRDDNRNTFRVKGTFIMDARWQSPLGTARTYLAIGADYISPAGGATTTAPPPTVYMERAFIQVAGFTVGYVETFFNPGGWWHTYGLSASLWNWNPAVAYTAQFGNGVSATLSIEDAQGHRTALISSIYTNSAALTNAYGGQTWPDVIANVRVDQAWGFVQIAGVVHQLRLNQAQFNLTGFGDRVGFAASFGADIKLGMLAPGDSIFFQAAVARGAVEYTGLSASPLTAALAIGLKTGISAALATGPVSQIYDAYARPGVATSMLLSTAWSVGAMARHYFQPNLWAGIGAGYNRYLPGGHDTLFINESPVLRITQVFGKILWNPIRNLDVGLDLLYSRVQTGNCPGNLIVALEAVQSCNRAADIFGGWVRIRQNF